MRRAGSIPNVPWRTAVLLALAYLLFPPPGVMASDTVTVPLFPGEVFHRDTGQPTAVVRSFSVPATEGTFLLRLVNGDGATDNLVSSAVVRVNGVALVSGKDLNQHVSTLERPVSNLVKGRNTLEVEVRSVPSSYITVTIEGTYLLGVRITDPAPSAALAFDRATVRGSWVGYTGDVGVVVNGVPAAITGSSFVAVDVPLIPGGNALTAAVTTFDGVRNTDAVTVSATGSKPALSLWSNYVSGVPPLTVTFRPEVEGIVPVEYRYDFDGDGVIDNTVATAAPVAFSFGTAGTYAARVTAVDAGGMEYMAEQTIVAQGRAEADTLLSARWNDFSASLQIQDISGGLADVIPERREKYLAILTPLAVRLPSIYASASPPELIKVEGDVAQYRVKREQLWEGVRRTITYYLWFSRDADGVWRIDRF